MRKQPRRILEWVALLKSQVGHFTAHSNEDRELTRRDGKSSVKCINENRACHAISDPLDTHDLDDG